MSKKIGIWTGTFRRSNKNIGIDIHQIGIELCYLIDNVKIWIKNKTYDPDEIRGRFHHRIVADTLQSVIFNMAPFTVL